MHRRLRIDVVKSDRILILPNDFCWDLSCDDFFENGHDILTVLIAGKLITVKSAHSDANSNRKPEDV